MAKVEMEYQYTVVGGRQQSNHTSIARAVVEASKSFFGDAPDVRLEATVYGHTNDYQVSCVAKATVEIVGG